jgi:RHS repeat-associated protein
VRGGQGVFYHQDGLGSTKALTDQAGNVTDSYQYEAYGNVVGRTGSTVNGYRYTGEYTDDSIQLQYNRDRYYSPYVGRFVSVDIFNGIELTPLTFNKYLYANANPVINVDPSGLFANIGELLNAQAVQAVLNAARSNIGLITGPLLTKTALLAVAPTLATYAIVSTQVKVRLQECMDSSRRGDNKCKGQNFYILGDDAAGVRDHVAAALTDGHHAVLRRQIPANTRGWLDANKGFGKPCSNAPDTQCDEYPYNSAIEGGKHNRVSLRSVPSRDNSVAGGFLGAFYTKCKISHGTTFTTILVSGIGSGYVCKD